MSRPEINEDRLRFFLVQLNPRTESAQLVDHISLNLNSANPPQPVNPPLKAFEVESRNDLEEENLSFFRSLPKHLVNLPWTSPAITRERNLKSVKEIKKSLKKTRFLCAQDKVKEMMKYSLTLAELYYHLELFDKAIKHADRVLQHYKVHSPQLIVQSRVLVPTLCLSYCNKNRHGEAEDVCIDSLAIISNLEGPQTQEVVEINSILATVYQEQGKFAEAETVLKKSLQICKLIYGEEHPKIISILRDLMVGCFIFPYEGSEKGFKNHLREAEFYGQQAIEMAAKIFGREHPISLELLQLLAEIYICNCDFIKSDKLLTYCLETQFKAADVHNLHMAKTLHIIGLSFLAQSNNVEAIKTFKAVIEIFEANSVGKDHPMHYELLFHMGEALISSGQGSLEQVFQMVRIL